MTRTRTITFSLLLAIAFGACGGSPSASGGSGTPGEPASSGSGDGHTIPGFEMPGISVAALAERDERVWAEAMRESGATALLGPGLYAWLDGVRLAFVDTVLAKGGIQAGGRIASTDPGFGAGPQTALGGGGMALAMAGLFLAEFSRSAVPDPDGGSSFTLPHSEEHATEVEGHSATAQVSISIDFTYAGSQLEGSVELTVTTTVVDDEGNVIGTITVKTRATVDMDVCPDLDGGLNGHFDTVNEVTITGAITGGGSSYNLTTSGVATGQVGEDANLHGIRVTGESSQRTSGPGTRAVDAAVHLDASGSYSTAGDPSTLTVDESSISEDVTRSDDTTTSEDITRLDIEVLGTGVVVAGLLFEAAQKKFRSGYCVRIEASEASRMVEPDEDIPFSAKVFHNFEGSEIDKPIVATLTGVASATPLDTPQDPPANITYTAGPDDGDQGTVKLKSTSNRGIAELALTFTVQPALVLQFEMESEITVTKLAGLPGGGVALVHGEILLEKDAMDHWSGMGDLTSSTTPAPLVCNSVSVAGSGTYNWWIRDVVARPEGTFVDLSMDAPPPVENPDTATTRLCPGGTSTSPINTWENLFFVSHFKDFQAMGFHVTGWTIVGTADTWKTGGLLAEAEWTENCNGPRAIPPPVLPPGISIGTITECTGETYMRLRLVPPPVP